MAKAAIDTRRKMRPGWWVLAGGLAIGTLDLVFAYTFWAPRGATMPGILQSIAMGWYGGQSRQMGTTSVAVGALSHYFIASMFVLAYWLVARRHPRLVQKPYPYGFAYGLLLYVLMNFVVLPLSAAGMPTLDNFSWVAASIAMHAVFGVMCALFARAAR